MTISLENCYYICDTGQDKTEWQSLWRINSSALTLDKVKTSDNQYNGFFTKRKAKMAGYWPSSFLHVYELRQSPGPKSVNNTCKAE